ncbi:MAG: putative DNA-binding domain-containing protein [Rhodanobacter sp.]
MHFPSDIAAQIDRLCTDARGGDAPIYGALLRDNVLDVLSCSFPRFCGACGRGSTAALASAFVVQHSSQRPQFHHIATEFVKFAQRSTQLTRRLLCLLEYEWALLAAEIDPRHVPITRVKSGLPAAELSLATNPTLRIVALPFDEAQFETSSVSAPGVDHVYAIYRSSRHAVLATPLYRADCLMLVAIQQTGHLDPFVRASCFPGHDTDATAAAWLDHALNHDLIYITDNFQGNPK